MVKHRIWWRINRDRVNWSSFYAPYLEPRDWVSSVTSKPYSVTQTNKKSRHRIWMYNLTPKTTFFCSKTSHFSQTVPYKCPKPYAMTQVLQNTLTYQIWIQSDKNWWFNTFFSYFVNKNIWRTFEVWLNFFTSDLLPVVYLMTVNI